MKFRSGTANNVKGILFGLFQMNKMSNYEHYGLVLTDNYLFLVPAEFAPNNIDEYHGEHALYRLTAGENVHFIDFKIAHNKQHKGFRRVEVYDEFLDSGFELTYTPFEKKNNKKFYKKLKEKGIKVIYGSKDYRDKY